MYSVLEADYEPVSMVVHIYFNPDHTTKPLMYHLPHWASKGETIAVVFAPDKVTGGYKFVKLLLPSTVMTLLSVSNYGHSSLFARAIKMRSQFLCYSF